MGILRADRVSGLGGANAINGSVRFDKRGYLFVSSHSDWSLDGDFTIECWVKRDASGAFADKFTIGDSKESTGLELYLGSGGASLVVYSNNGGILVAAAGSYSANVWHHLALVRSGNTIKLYVDGTADNNTATNTATFSGDLRLGAEFYNNPTTPSVRSSFYMSNFRIVKGTALYTANFTVPAQRLENISGTAILCCQSPGDVTQEATGKTITPINISIISSTNLDSSVPYATHIAPDVGEDHGTTFTDNTKFDTLTYMVPPGGTTIQRGRGRGVFGGGAPFVSPNAINAIQYIEISAGGIFQDFGDLTSARGYFPAGPTSSSTRGISHGGWDGSNSSNVIEYITIATTSNSLDFGDSSVSRMSGACSNQTRCLTAGDAPNLGNEILYITIASTGNTTDFGDLVTARGLCSGVSSPTRGVWGGGRNNTPSSNTQYNTLEYVTIASTGNTTDFGDIASATRYATAGLASKTRGVFSGGYDPSGNCNRIDYITIATTGNSSEFGDLAQDAGFAGSISNSIRGVISQGSGPGANTYGNSIEYITIASTGDALDFGDAHVGTKGHGNFPSCISDSHGGVL